MSNALSEFQNRIRSQVIAIGKGNIPEDEKTILRLLFFAYERKLGLDKSDGPVWKVTQQEIANRLPDFGGEKKYEKAADTTPRRVRRVIRDLRTKRWAPILSDKNGYFIPLQESEVREYLERVEGEVKARVSASFETYKAVKDTFGVSSAFFEGQEKLIKDDPVEVEVPSNTKPEKTYKTYRISGTSDYICTCPGYQYRKKCSHIDKLKEVLENKESYPQR